MRRSLSSEAWGWLLEAADRKVGVYYDSAWQADRHGYGGSGGDAFDAILPEEPM